MNRVSTFASRLALVALTTLALSACETNPAKPQPAAAVPPLLPAQAAPVSLVEMQHQLDLKAMDLENTRTMALIKFADQSGSDFAKGLVSGMLGKSGAASPPATAQRASFAQMAMQQQAQAADIDIRKAELAERTSWFNKGLQVTDRVLGYRMFGKNLEHQRYSLDASNSQQRYLFDSLRGTQQDAYGFSGTVLEHGPYVLPAGATDVPASTPAAE